MGGGGSAGAQRGAWDMRKLPGEKDAFLRTVWSGMSRVKNRALGADGRERVR